MNVIGALKFAERPLQCIYRLIGEHVLFKYKMFFEEIIKHLSVQTLCKLLKFA